MGQLTRDTILSEALLLAGDDRLTERAKVWLNTWLTATYDRFNWPFLQRNYQGMPFASGVTKITIGNGLPVGNVIAEQIKYINSPIGVYDSGYTLLVNANVQQVSSLPEQYMSNPATNIGVPTLFRVRHAVSQWGKWDIVPNIVPDRNLLLAINYQPTVLHITDGTQVPIYPNDRTMIQAVITEAYRYMRSMEEYAHELEVLSEMVKGDKLTYGTGVPGSQDVLQLDPAVFR